jgi:Transcriptional regulator of heat shock gene
MALSELVQDMLDQEPAAKNVRVFIGGESSSAFLNDCALVLGGYTVDNQIVGGLGIIGPKRMDYGKTIATVQYVSETLSNILSRFSI